tara:strand:+ start:7112 stop:8068 length:957 start_codon:yes stop_codon:yes gene_type:complete
MNYKPILVVAGEPKSIFYEIFFKSIKAKKFKSPIILIASRKIIKKEVKKYKYKKNISEIADINLNLKKNSLYFINVNFPKNKNLNNKKINSNIYVNNCFKKAFKILGDKVTDKFINGPISKKNFLNKKFLGMTEFISYNFSTKNNAMLIYNKKLSVCPLTTHLPIKMVAKKINKKMIIEKVSLIHKFYKNKFKIKPKIGVLGLNPHCESIQKFNEDDVILRPTIKSLKKLNYKISGPFSADTIFLKQNRKKFDVIIGMYHDQVLTPLKTLFEYDAINITLGLPFIRISPDHGPNEKMIGKNKSNPLSLIKAISFLDKN